MDNKNKNTLASQLMKVISGISIESSSDANNYQLRKPELTYISKDGRVTTDSCYDTPTNWYNDWAYSTILKDSRRKSYQYLSSLLQNGIVSAIVDTLSSEATRSSIQVVSKNETEDEDKEAIEYITTRLQELNIATVLRDSLRSSYIFGGSCIFIEINNNYDSDRLEIEFTPSPLTISKDMKLTNLNVVDPIYCVPIDVNVVNPLDKNFYLPNLYSVMGRTVHSSRLYRLVTQEVPDNMKPMYNFFGISLVQQCEEYIYRFEEFTQNINEIVKRMRTSIFSTSMSSLLTGDASEEEIICVKNSLNTRYSMLHKGNNNSLVLLDKELEDFKEINTNISGLSDLLGSIAEQVCIIPKIPATKLLGISPKGMNATGESDMNNFYDEISKIQKNILTPFVQKVIDLLYMEYTGKKNDSLYPEFEKLNKQELLDAQVNASYINDVVRSVETGIISHTEARERLSQIGWSLPIDDFTDIDKDEEEYLSTILNNTSVSEPDPDDTETE